LVHSPIIVKVPSITQIRKIEPDAHEIQAAVQTAVAQSQASGAAQQLAQSVSLKGGIVSGAQYSGALTQGIYSPAAYTTGSYGFSSPISSHSLLNSGYTHSTGSLISAPSAYVSGLNSGYSGLSSGLIAAQPTVYSSGISGGLNSHYVSGLGNTWSTATGTHLYKRDGEKQEKTPTKN